MLHANFAVDSIPQTLQAFLMITGGLVGLLAAFSLVDESPASDSSALSAEVRLAAESRVQSPSRMPVERGAPGRRF